MGRQVRPPRGKGYLHQHQAKTTARIHQRILRRLHQYRRVVDQEDHLKRIDLRPLVGQQL